MEVIADSARRHGISDEDIIHAYRNAVQADALDEGVTLLIGPDLAGRLVEIAYVVADDETVVIIHAMPARKHKIR